MLSLSTFYGARMRRAPCPNTPPFLAGVCYPAHRLLPLKGVVSLTVSSAEQKRVNAAELSTCSSPFWQLVGQDRRRGGTAATGIVLSRMDLSFLNIRNISICGEARSPRHYL